MRLLHAAYLFLNPGLSVSDVAYRLDYSSPQSFGRHLKAMLGVTAGEFRSPSPSTSRWSATWTCSSPRTGRPCALFTPSTRGSGTKDPRPLACPGRGDQSAAARVTGGSRVVSSRLRTEKRAMLARNRSASWASCCDVAVRSPIEVIWVWVAAAAPSALCEEPLEMAATCCSDCASSASRCAWPRDTSAVAF